MKNSFAPLTSGENRFSRKWGGTQSSTVDPYVTGYHFIYFSYLPPSLGNMVAYAGGPDQISSHAEIKNVLTSACLSVTLPGGTVNKAEFNGIGNIRYAVPSNIDYDNTITIRFLEFSGLPILAIFHGWCRMMRDYRSGASTLSNDIDTYGKSNYAASMFYWTTQPNGKWVEEYECCTGMFPMKDPRDQYGHDITAYDKLEIDIDFNVDTMWHEAWVRERCQELAEEYHGAWGGSTTDGVVNGYGEANAADN